MSLLLCLCLSSQHPLFSQVRQLNEWLPATHLQPKRAIPYETLPFTEMPHIVNPPSGWFVSANNDPIGTTLDNNPLNQFRPGGVSGILGSPFYFNLLPNWLTNDAFRLLFSDDEIQQNALSVTRFVPAH